MGPDHQTPPPAPQPSCEKYEALLPLVNLHELDDAEEAEVQAHVAGCPWCQAQLDSYAGLRLALRRHYGAEHDAQPLPMFTAITRAGNDTDPDLTAEMQPPTPIRLPTRPQRPRLTALAALAATLLIAVLAGTLFHSRMTTTGAASAPGLGELTRYALPAADSQPRAITSGDNGRLWFTENGKIGHITTNGAITEYPLPQRVTPNDLALGSDGAVWFTEDNGSIGRLNPGDGKVIEHTLPTHGAIPLEIVAGNDGALWFMAQLGARSLDWEVGRITPAGDITEIALSGFAFTSMGITVGPDGAIWFCGASDIGPDIVGRVSPSGAIKHYQLPEPNSGPYVIVTGPDGALWFNGLGVSDGSTPSHIWRITLAGAATSFTIPNSAIPSAYVSFPTDLAVGPDNAIWFVAGEGHVLGRITTGGAMKTFTLPPGFIAASMVTGTDGALWFTDPAHNAIDRLSLSK